MSESVVLGVDTLTSDSVSLGDVERRQGLYVIGGNGTGKTTLLLNLILQDIANGHGLCILDPHGDLVRDILALVPLDREEDVVLLDPLDSDYPFGLNLFECGDPANLDLVAETAEQVVHIFKKIWGPGAEEASWGPQLEDLLRNVALTLVENQGFTMVEIPRLLQDEQFRAALVGKLQNVPVQEFWKYTYNPLRDDKQREIQLSTLNKVRRFLTNPTVYHIVGQSRSTIDFPTLMDQSKIILMSFSLRLGEDVIALLGSMVAAKILNAAYARADQAFEERRAFHFFADEYHRFATEDFATLLAEARKYGVATAISHQFREQIDRENRGATLNVANLVVFKISGQDAEEMAAQFDCTPAPQQMAVCPEPLEYIERYGHPNPEVTKLVTEMNALCDHTLRQIEIDCRAFSYRFDSAPHRLQQLRHSVDTFLYSYMSTQHQPEPFFSMGKNEFFMFAAPYIPQQNQRLDIAIKWNERYIRLKELLMKEPVLLPSGPVKTHAEVQNEIANKLANLPRRQLRCKIQQSDDRFAEHTVQTLPPPPSYDSEMVRQRVERIRTNSRANYARPRAELQREIEERQRRDAPLPIAQRRVSV